MNRTLFQAKPYLRFLFCQNNQLLKKPLKDLSELANKEEKIINEETTLTSPNLPKQEIQTVQKEGETYVEDYTKAPTKTEVHQDGDNYIAEIKINETTIKYYKTTSQQLDLKGNPLALQVLAEGQIDLKDPRIQITSFSGDESIGAISNVTGLKQINLGVVEVLKENSINIRDVDVHQIPDDMDITLDQKLREVRVIGVKSESGNTDGKVSQQIVEDVTLDELKEKYLYKFEYKFVVLDKVEVLKKLIRRLPLYILIFCFIDTLAMLYSVKSEIARMEDQEWQPFRDLFSQKELQMLKTDDRFMRSKILKTS